MDTEKPTEGQPSEPEQKSRRDFVKTSAQVAVTAPAVAMLLSGVSKSAHAQINNYQASQSHILDDFTTGNNREDVDALNRGSNTSFNLPGTPNLDDHV
jgi:hypothetical protein